MNKPPDNFGLYSMIFLSFVIFSSCHQGKGQIIDKNKNPEKLSYAIQDVQIVQDSDTSKIAELRFFDIKSALDAHALMYDHFGDFSEKMSSKYQENINQLLWYKVRLLADDQVFDVATDGTETMTNYFSAFIIFDSKGLNCFEKNHPLRDQLLEALIPKMKKVKGKSRSSKYYNKFR